MHGNDMMHAQKWAEELEGTGLAAVEVQSSHACKQQRFHKDVPVMSATR